MSSARPAPLAATVHRSNAPCSFEAKATVRPSGDQAGSRSSAGPLVSRLVALGFVPDGASVLVEQGHALGRPSRIQVQVSGERVRIGGAAVVVAEGTLTV